MLGGPGGTGCNVPVHSCWDSRDVIVAAVFDCVKEWNWLQWSSFYGLQWFFCQRACEFCNVIGHLLC